MANTQSFNNKMYKITLAVAALLAGTKAAGSYRPGDHILAKVQDEEPTMLTNYTIELIEESLI